MTTRKLAEQALRESEALYHSLVDTLPVNIFRKDRQGQFTFVNRNFCEMLGRSEQDVLGRTDFDLYPEHLAQKYCDDDRRVLDSGETLASIEENQIAGGELRYVQVWKTPVYDFSQRIVGTQAIFWDITTIKRAEVDLAAGQGRGRGRQPGQERIPGQHEPRNSHAHERHSGHDRAGARHAAHARAARVPEHWCTNSAESLLTVINDILDFSKIEAGKLELDARSSSTCATAWATRSSRWRCEPHMKGLELACHIAPDVPDDAGRRRRPAAADHRQPGRQRHQVHRARRSGRATSSLPPPPRRRR